MALSDLEMSIRWFLDASVLLSNIVLSALGAIPRNPLGTTFGALETLKMRYSFSQIAPVAAFNLQQRGTRQRSV